MCLDRWRSGANSPPDDFLEIRKGNAIVWFRKGYSFLLDGQGMWRADLGFCPRTPHSLYSGRGRIDRVPLDPMAEGCAVLRHYRRGGLIRYVLGDSYLSRRRFFQEVKVSEWARQQGVPTAEVLAMRSETRVLGLHRADLVTREIPRSEDLDRYLRSWIESGRGSARDRKEVRESVALLIRRMHNAGLYHADLNLKNIVIQPTRGGIRSYVIDLDRARVIRPLSSRQKVRNLLRFYRSLEKQGYVDKVIRLRDVVGFVKAYSGTDKELERMCKERIRKDMLLLRYHRAVWRLSRRLKGGRAGL